MFTDPSFRTCPLWILGIWVQVPLGFSGSSGSKESACKAGDSSSIPGLGRSPGEGNGKPLQYCCLGNSMDREAWRATVHGVAKTQDMTEWLTHFTHTSSGTISFWSSLAMYLVIAILLKKAFLIVWIMKSLHHILLTTTWFLLYI